MNGISEILSMLPFFQACCSSSLWNINLEFHQLLIFSIRSDLGSDLETWTHKSKGESWLKQLSNVHAGAWHDLQHARGYCRWRMPGERERELSYPPIMPRVRVGTALSRARRYCGTLRICLKDSSDLDASWSSCWIFCGECILIVDICILQAATPPGSILLDRYVWFNN